jgi:hypothetical protein
VVSALPDFVHTKGTLFLLYPGRAMLQVLAAAAGDQRPSGHRHAKAPT